MIFTSPPTLLFAPTLDNFRKIGTLYDLACTGEIESRHQFRVNAPVVADRGALRLCARKARRHGGHWRWPTSSWASARCRRSRRCCPSICFMRDIGLLGTTAAVILIDTVLNCAFVTWMMFSYFRALPPEMNEAALTDGCTLWVRLHPRGPALRAVGTVGQRVVLPSVFLERFSICELPDAARQQARLGGARDGLRDLRHQLGNSGRACALWRRSRSFVMVVLLNRFFVGGLVRGVH